jgi:putative transposase
VAKTRQVRRDGIHFQGLRYLDATLAAFVGETVVIRYDPRDLAEIRIYYQDRFLCRAVCQELASATVSLKEIVQARRQRRRDLQQVIRDHAELVQRYLAVHHHPPEFPLAPADLPASQGPQPSPPGLKLYANG